MLSVWVYLGNPTLQPLDTGHVQFRARHNAEENKNRKALTEIFNCIKLCCKCELPLRGHDEFSKSENPGIFLCLLDFACEFDTTLKAYSKSDKAFKGISKTI